MKTKTKILSCKWPKGKNWWSSKAMTTTRCIAALPNGPLAESKTFNKLTNINHYEITIAEARVGRLAASEWAEGKGGATCWERCVVVAGLDSSSSKRVTCLPWKQRSRPLVAGQGRCLGSSLLLKQDKAMFPAKPPVHPTAAVQHHSKVQSKINKGGEWCAMLPQKQDIGQKKIRSLRIPFRTYQTSDE